MVREWDARFSQTCRQTVSGWRHVLPRVDLHRQHVVVVCGTWGWTPQVTRLAARWPWSARTRSGTAASRSSPERPSRAVALGSYFGQDMKAVVDRLLSEQLRDGGWDCE